MTPLPLSVIGGFLGAGKTTLINKLLTADHGLRLAVLVNDFGAINIDATLLKSAGEDTIELTNGCVCCTMSGDLFFAIGDILDRPDRPDHIIVEASGIANPAKIAAVALAEKELRYSGILTIVDGLIFPSHIADPAIADQLRAQVLCADLVAVSKAPLDDPSVKAALDALGVSGWVSADDADILRMLLLAQTASGPPASDPQATHPDYVQWSCANPPPMTREAITQRLASVPSGILRVKALVPCDASCAWEVHVVGARTTIEQRAVPDSFGVVALGRKDAITSEDIERWWRVASGA